jgi:hypothetical protein
MLGKAIATNRNKNSHITLPRRVTLIPTGMPSRNLKLDTLILALTTTGACPDNAVISFLSSSMPFLSNSTPKELLRTTFSTLGT